MTDFSTLCFEASFALLIALLAWGDQIRQPRRTVTEVESSFLRTLGLKRAEVNPIIHDSYVKATASTNYTFTDILNSIVGLAKKGRLDSQTTSVLTQLTRIDSARDNLERHYVARYFLTLALTFATGLFGAVALLQGAEATTPIAGTAVLPEELYGGAIGGLVLALLANLLLVYVKENRFLRLIEGAGQMIEVT